MKIVCSEYIDCCAFICDSTKMVQIKIHSAPRNSTYMLVCYVAYVTHVHDATLVSNHADGDGVFAHLRRHVLVNLDP